MPEHPEILSLHREMGALGAEVKAVVARQDRTEDAFWAVLGRLETKVDEVRTTLSTRSGASKMGQAIFAGAIAVLTVGATLVGGVVLHFTAYVK